MSKDPKKEKRKERKTYPGPNPTDNEQMLQDIRETLAAHQRESAMDYPRNRVTPSPQTVRESTTPSPAAELNSPGTSRAKPRPSPVDYERQRRMAQIRDSLKPHRAEQGQLTVNEGMLVELVSRGYDHVSVL